MDTDAPQKILLANPMSPGDILVMTAAIRCLHEQYPGKYAVDVDVPVRHIFEHNLDITPLDRDDPEVRRIDMKYPLINSSNQRHVHFLQGYSDFLGEQLGVKLVMTHRRPFLWLSDEEKMWTSQVQEITRSPVKFWVVNSGIKSDFVTKGWGTNNFQQLVDMLYGRIQFVQIGEAKHNHKPLANVIDLVGMTDARQLIRLCSHAQGGVGPVTFLMHIMAAFEKPYVCLLGGREPLQWEYYPTMTVMSTVGTLPCCHTGGCWKSRVVPLNDGDEKDSSLCALPVLGGPEPLPKCMTMITPEHVAEAIDRYYAGGILSH